MSLDFYNILGFFGTFLYILSYALLQLNRIDQTFIYTWLNFFGASFVAISLTEHFNAPSFVIQLTWITISAVGLIKLYKGKKQKEYFYSYCSESKIPTHLIIEENGKMVEHIPFEEIDWKDVDSSKLSNQKYYTIVFKYPTYQSPPNNHMIDTFLDGMEFKKQK